MVTLNFGDIVLAAGGPCSSKPRPVLIFQNELHPTGESIVVMPFTSQKAADQHYRIFIEPTSDNGLDRPCWLEIEKVSAIRRASLGPTIGALDQSQTREVIRLSRQLMSPAG